MKIINKQEYYFESGDYIYINTQLKANKIKVGAFCKANGFSRQFFYNVIRGKCKAPIEVLQALSKHNIVLPFRVGIDG